MNLSEHKMKNREWIREYIQSMGVIAFQEYECRVWEALEQLKDNSFYDIRKIVKEENLDLFIKPCCKFILTHPEYEFSEDYTKIIKRCY